MISGGISHVLIYERVVGGIVHVVGQISMAFIIPLGGTWRQESHGWSGKAGRTI